MFCHDPHAQGSCSEAPPGITPRPSISPPACRSGDFECPSPSCTFVPPSRFVPSRSVLSAAGSPVRRVPVSRVSRARACVGAGAGARILRRRAYRAPGCACARVSPDAGRTFPVGFSGVFSRRRETGQGAAPRMPLPSFCPILARIFRKQARARNYFKILVNKLASLVAGRNGQTRFESRVTIWSEPRSGWFRAGRPQRSPPSLPNPPCPPPASERRQPVKLKLAV